MYAIVSNEDRKGHLCLRTLKKKSMANQGIRIAKIVSEILISPTVLWAVWICAMDNNRLTAEVVDVVLVRHSFFTAVTWHHQVATSSFLNLSNNLNRKTFAIN